MPVLPSVLLIEARIAFSFTIIILLIEMIYVK